VTILALGGLLMPVLLEAGYTERRALGIITGSSPIATQIPHAAGIAYAMQYRGEDAVVGCWFGDGATSEGDWHEGLNFAGIHRLPVIFVCETTNTRSASRSQADGRGRRRRPCRGLRFPASWSTERRLAYWAMKQAHERARAGEGPTLIECKTYRFLGHTSDDDDKTYRPRDEVEEARHNDPVHVFGEYLRTQEVLDDVGAEELRLEIKGEIDTALAAAWDAADPAPESAMRHVFFEGEA
jgi:2-oxoisovalerate dehydrogenase E1 component alpha subunit